MTYVRTAFKAIFGHKFIKVALHTSKANDRVILRKVAKHES